MNYFSNSIQSFFYQGSVFEVVNLTENDFRQSRSEVASSSLLQRVANGIPIGVEDQLKAYLPFFLIANLAKVVFKGLKIEELPATKYFDFFTVVISGPILEEIIFIAVLQNIIYMIQGIAKMILPSFIKETRLFTFLTSSSSRIMCIGMLFAWVHRGNAGNLYSSGGALAQVTVIALYPSSSLTYERTGSLITVITAHMIYNYCGFIIPEILGDVFSVIEANICSPLKQSVI